MQFLDLSSFLDVQRALLLRQAPRMAAEGAALAHAQFQHDPGHRRGGPDRPRLHRAQLHEAHPQGTISSPRQQRGVGRLTTTANSKQQIIMIKIVDNKAIFGCKKMAQKKKKLCSRYKRLRELDVPGIEPAALWLQCMRHVTSSMPESLFWPLKRQWNQNIGWPQVDKTRSHTFDTIYGKSFLFQLKFVPNVRP